MHSVKNKVLFVLGGPGSGKGTQCDNLVGRFKFTHLSAGDLLRKEVKADTELGKQINNFIKNGDMVPGDVTVTLIKNAMAKKKGVFIIDGYPRNQSNIDFWESVIKDEVEVVGCLFLKCSEETMKKRIMKRGETSGRADDNEEVVANRVRVYNEETLPILDYFVKKNKLFEVSAEGTIDDCFSTCKQAVRDLKLDKFVKMNEMKNYLADNVDVYIKPLIVYIMKNKPTDVHEAILYWIKNEGVEIKSQLEAKKDCVEAVEVTKVVEVTKIVEVPVEVTKIVEVIKVVEVPVEVEVEVEVPVEVTKIVEVPVEVTKIVEVPVEVTKIVEVPVEVPVEEVKVETPVPVEEVKVEAPVVENNETPTPAENNKENSNNETPTPVDPNPTPEIVNNNPTQTPEEKKEVQA